jgi:hypothetical protein
MTTTSAPDTRGPAGDLGYLHPDRLRLGGTAVFAGDWTTEATGLPIPTGYIGVLIDRWNGWAVWSCTREVAEAVVADQHQARAAHRAQAAADGPDGPDLDEAVDETLPELSFDGDTIVYRNRLQEETRFDPDEAGEYVICGWMWTWQAVDPADCRRIVGTIPADGDHQRWVQLPHTELRVPHDRLRVTSLEQLQRPNGVASTTSTVSSAPRPGRGSPSSASATPTGTPPTSSPSTNCSPATRSRPAGHSAGTSPPGRS